MPEPLLAIPPARNGVLVSLLLAHLAVVLVFFWPFLFAHKAFFADHTARYSPWRESTDAARVAELDREANIQMTDDLYMFHPEVLLSVASLKRGELPTWNPYAFGGYPHIATGIPSFYYPLMALHLLGAPLRAYGFAAALQALLAGFFMSAFLLRLGLHPLATLLGGCVYVYGGWMTAHMLYYQITGASAWLGLMLLGTDLWLRDGRRAGAAALAIAVAVSFLSGFPQTAVLNTYLALAYGALIAIRRSRIPRELARAAWRLAWPVALGGMLAGAQLLPSWWLTVTGSSNRQLPTLAELEQFRLPWPALLTIVFPNLFGHPHIDAQLVSPELHKHQLLALAHLGNYSGYTEIQGYVGLIPLVLALVGSRRQLRWLAWFSIAILVLSFLAATGTVVAKALVLVPGIRVGDLKRFLFPASVALAWLAALGLDRLLAPPGARSRLALAGASLACILLLAGAAWLHLRADRLPHALADHVAASTGTPASQVLAAVDPRDFERQRETLLAGCVRGGLLLGLASLLLFLAARGRPLAPALLLTALAAADLVTHGRDLGLPGWLGPGFIRSLDPDGFLAPHPLITAMQSAAGGEPFRVMRRVTRFEDELVFPPKTLQPFGIEDAQGYAALYLDRYQRWIEAIPGTATEGCTAVRGLQTDAALRSPALDLLNVRFVIAREAIADPSFALLAERDGVRIYDNREVWPRAFVARDALVLADRQAVLARVTSGDLARDRVLLEREPSVRPRSTSGSPAADHVTWRARSERSLELDVESGGGWLVVTDCFDPAWRAAIDGEPAPIEPAYGAFRAVALTAGTHRVRFEHTGHAEKAGLALSLMSALVLAGTAIARPRPGR